MTKWPVKTNIEQQKRAEQQDVTDIQNKQFLCVLDFLSFIWDFLNWILQEMLSYRVGTDNDVHWGFKTVLS